MSPLQIVFAVIASIGTAIGLAMAIATMLVKHGRWGGSKDTVVDRLEKALEKAADHVASQIDSVNTKIDGITEKLGGQDVTLARHGEQLEALRQRMDDFAGRKQRAAR